MRRKVHILIIGRPGLMRDGICALLNSERGMKVAGLAASASHAMSTTTALTPDLALVDLSVDSRSGVEIVPGVRQRWPDIPIVVMSFRQEYDPNTLVISEHPRVHVLETHTRAELMSIIRNAFPEGRRRPHTERRNTPSKAPPQAGPAAPAAPVLTEREVQVMKLIAAGYRTREIALRLFVSSKTVEKHRGNLMRKLGLRSATAVTAYAIARGYWAP